jgi:hypothetical protein
MVFEKKRRTDVRKVQGSGSTTGVTTVPNVRHNNAFSAGRLALARTSLPVTGVVVHTMFTTLV